MDDPKYAELGSRLLALFVDGVVLFVLMFGLALIDVLLLPANDELITVLFVLSVHFYEPLLVWHRGRTVGHQFAGIRVFRASGDSGVGFLQAVARWWLKLLVGPLTLVLLLFTARRQAVHDWVTSTVVVEVDDGWRSRLSRPVAL